MKTPALCFAATLFAAIRLFAVDLRETQFPAKPSPSITVAGGDFPSSECLKPWITTDPTDYTGTYESRTITDGNARLTLRLHQAKSSSGEQRWHVDGTWETKAGVGVAHVVTLKNAELREPKQPCFDVLDRLTFGLFVIFTDPESKDPKPKHAVVIGDNVFVLAKELKAGS